MMQQLPIPSAGEIRAAADRAVAVLRANLPAYTEKFPDSNSVDYFYPAVENTEWTTGFCTGTYWLSYELTGDEAFSAAALRQAESFLDRIERRIDVDHHDMGFLYSPSCVTAYRLKGSETGKRAALLAADNLTARFHEKGQFLQAWGKLGAPDNYRLIIDCLLNLPLLYWASETTGNPRYREIALAHTRTSLDNLVRPDGSAYHTYFFDPETGAPLRGVTAQGYRNGSAWARGQAWGIYGLALCRRHTGGESCLPLFRRAADFFLSRLPDDGVPYWDLDFTEEDGQPKDSSAAAVAVCGLLEMCPYLPVAEAARYRTAALQMLGALMRTCAVRSPEVSNGLLLHGVYAKASPYNTVGNRGVDECNTWGDYFYLEALTRLSIDWVSYW